MPQATCEVASTREAKGRHGNRRSGLNDAPVSVEGGRGGRAVSARRNSSVSRIVFAAAAYLGDVAPFVEPANRLVERGHEVEFVVPSGFHQMLAGELFRLKTYPLDFSPAG